ncbi:retrovirus-related Pol polyprotein from transposon TNT 1-94 [Trichonephila clavipes]|uniref:Retrovirus-related Pol polyprotein from transposon TNT 1-94 n=1 Tax=Trichonephila clavipes TaxID=2585209 RepID=A0A8X6RDW7_TRICX|nr:retrovirus-related Pol polyprotein from transposon TNT 1-94 [Trichonephila clavipes]
MKQDLEKAENAYLSSFTSKKSKTRYLVLRLQLMEIQMARMITKRKVVSKNDSVKGLPRLTDNGKTHCIPCKLAKSKRVSFKKTGAVRSKRPLELLHMDLCGPMPTESQGGNKYFLSIIDDYSRKVTVFPIRNKSDVFHTFIRFQKRAERFLSRKVIAVRTDGGLEFCNKDMDNFLTELGIKHEVTNSYTPEMNGVAERFNLTALDGIKTLLKSSEVPHKFWGEALLCFTYAWNRICHKDSNKTPFEKYSGRKPSVLHLKPFGCLAYADENKLVETINVRFDENKRGINFKQKVNSNLGYNLNLPDYYDDEDDFDRVKDSLTSRLVSKTSTEMPSTSEKPGVSSDNHSLIPCTEVKWIRNIGRKVTGSNVYYSIEGEATRLKSFNEIERYCKRHNIEYDPSLFNFRKDNTESQGFSDLSEQQEALMVEVTIPNCYKQAIRSRDASKWHDAMDKEINVMKERKVWDLVDHPDNIKNLENRWVYTIKYDENNKIVRYKARLVARDTVIYMKQPTGYEIDNNKVYDMIIFGKEMENVNFVLQLLQKNFDLKIMGKTKKLLEIEFEEIGNSLFIHQRSYIRRLCEIYEKYKYPVSSLPISKGQVLSKLDSPKTSEEILTVPYRNLIGSLSFIAIRTRPDIMYAVNVLSQFQANPGIKHWNCLLRLLGYLKYTQEYKLELSKVKSLKLRCYSDSDFATNRDDRVSMGGFITFIDETAISWRTFKQKSVSLSTMEAEYVSLTEAAKEFIWLKNVIDNKSLNLELSENVMFCDNQAAISFSKSPVENYRTKHIDVRYHFLRNLIYDKTARGGRVRSTTPAEDIYIVLSAKRNRRITAQQVANQFLAASGKQISRKTVARRLRGGGLYARRPVVCVPLTRQHRNARLQWCREHHNWTEQDWACVLFSDESRFSLSSDCRRQLIWRESGTAYRPESIQEKDRYPTCSIMVWAGIMINGRMRLHVVANGTMTGQRYIHEVLLPHVRLFRGAVGDKFVFMDDNATCHRTLAVQDCLDSEGIQRLVWPARSPDLNPIENVWDALGRQVAGRNYPPINKNTLIRALTEEWAKLPQQLLDNVVQSMVRRVECCITLHGGHIPY